MEQPRTICRTGGDWHAVFDLLELSFGKTWLPEERNLEALVADRERSLGAYGNGRLVGHAASFSLRLSVPGGVCPAAGVSLVGVHPTFRRQGILSDLLRHQLDDIYEQGCEPVAVLNASEAGIYGRFGYGVASYQVGVEVSNKRCRVDYPQSSSDVALELVEPREAAAACMTVRERVVAERPGMFYFDQQWSERIFADPPQLRKDKSPLRCVVARLRDDQVTGFALYRVDEQWGMPDRRTYVQLLHADDPASSAALWRYLFSLDLTERTACGYLSLDSPLVAVLSDIRHSRLQVRDGLWLRVVDVGKALAARAYSAPLDTVIGVRDEACPWNARSWHLCGNESAAECQETIRDPDVVLGVKELGALFLGKASAIALARAGLVEERTRGALQVMSRAFVHDLDPYCDVPF